MPQKHSQTKRNQRDKQLQKKQPEEEGGYVISSSTIIVLSLLGFLFTIVTVVLILNPKPAKSPSETSSTATLINTSTPAGKEFDYREVILRCGNYRVQRGDKWDTIAQVCDMKDWEQVSVTPDTTYPGKAIIKWRVGKKYLEFAWSGNALILLEAWETR